MPDSILVVDDDKEFANVTSASLEMEGYRVHVAHNSITGWKEMERCQPDIMLVDWEMPEMSGIEFIKLIKDDAVHRTRYIIIVTGRIGTENVVQGLDAGADDYLIKPFQMEELLARIRSGLRIRSLENRIVEEAKRVTVMAMALSVADKVGNPIAAAKLYQQLLLENPQLATLSDVIDSLRSLGSLLDEALQLINQYQAIKTPRSIPAPGGKTMIAPE
jgi:sigma-B regulation protein RsbU (phosphoserine phosphatase)